MQRKALFFGSQAAASLSHFLLTGTIDHHQSKGGVGKLHAMLRIELVGTLLPCVRQHHDVIDLHLL